MSVKRWLPLIGIFVCVFVFNMSEFMPVGLLTSIADDLDVRESDAGMLISVYAWAVAILSLPIMLVLRKMQYRPMLLMCVGLFIAFQAASALSADYWTLMASRIGVAVAHSVFWSIASPLAVRVVDPGYQRLAISAVALGTSMAMILGLPLGRVIGLALGWRMTFLSIAVISLMVLLLLIAVFPKLRNPGTFTVRRVPEIFRDRVIVSIYGSLVVTVVGIYCCYSYIEPFLLDFAGLSPDMVTVYLTAYGVAGILGSYIFTKVYGTRRFPFLAASFLGGALAMVLLNPSAPHHWILLADMAFWGICITGFNVSYQNEIIKASPIDAVPIVMSLFSGLFNAGIAMGSMAGGFVTDSIGVEWIGYVGGISMGIASLFVCLVLIRLLRRQTPRVG